MFTGDTATDWQEYVRQVKLGSTDHGDGAPVLAESGHLSDLAFEAAVASFVSRCFCQVSAPHVRCTLGAAEALRTS